MSFRIGESILQSLVNTNCKFYAPPPSGMGVVQCVFVVENRPFCTSLQAFRTLHRSLARLSNKFV